MAKYQHRKLPSRRPKPATSPVPPIIPIDPRVSQEKDLEEKRSELTRIEDRMDELEDKRDDRSSGEFTSREESEYDDLDSDKTTLEEEISDLESSLNPESPSTSTVEDKMIEPRYGIIKRPLDTHMYGTPDDISRADMGFPVFIGHYPNSNIEYIWDESHPLDPVLAKQIKDKYYADKAAANKAKHEAAMQKLKSRSNSYKTQDVK
jgi:hypothetical protein